MVLGQEELFVWMGLLPVRWRFRGVDGSSLGTGSHARPVVARAELPLLRVHS